jgi:photosystem II stability/assembly factor-like uncharacterized protein
MRLTAVLILCITIVMTGCDALSDKHDSVPDTTSHLDASSSTGSINTPMSNPEEIQFAGIKNVRMMDDRNGWILTESSVLRTSDGGQIWKDVTPQGAQLSSRKEVRGIQPRAAFIDSSVAFVAVPQLNNGTVSVYRTVVAGNEWTKSEVKSTVFTGITPDVTTVTFSDKNHGWILIAYDTAMGSQAVEIFHTTDGGGSWSSLGAALGAVDVTKPIPSGAIPLGGVKSGISFSDSENGWLSGFWHGDGVWLYETHDGGTKWAAQKLTVPQGIPAEGGAAFSYSPVFFSNKIGILPVQFSLTTVIFYETKDGGVSWKPTTPILSTSQNGFDWSFTDATHGFATDGNELFITSDGAKTWEKVPVAGVLTGIIGLEFTDGQIGYAYGINWIKKTTDGGNTFNGHLNFINSVQPPEGSSSDETNIKIYFSRDMNQATVNSKTIEISEAKHSSHLTDLYQFNYDPKNRVLTLHPKNNEFDFGTENTVTIKISGTIQDQTGKVMGSEYSWSFKTSK